MIFSSCFGDNLDLNIIHGFQIELSCLSFYNISVIYSEDGNYESIFHLEVLKESGWFPNLLFAFEEDRTMNAINFIYFDRI